MKRSALLFFIIFSHFTVFAQSIDGFTLPNTTNGETFTLANLKSEKAVVLIFYSGKCAYGEYYLDRIIALKNEFSSKDIKFVLINSNNSDFVAEESVKEMKNFTVQHNLNIPYLADKKKYVKNLLKASRTPEVFVLIPSGQQFKVVYKGAIDDNPQSASDVSHAYLQDALLNLLKNKPVEVNQTRPIGCLIK